MWRQEAAHANWNVHTCIPIRKRWPCFSCTRKDKISYLYNWFIPSHTISQNNILLEILQDFVSYKNVITLCYGLCLLDTSHMTISFLSNEGSVLLSSSQTLQDRVIFRFNCNVINRGKKREAELVRKHWNFSTSFPALASTRDSKNQLAGVI